MTQTTVGRGPVTAVLSRTAGVRSWSLTVRDRLRQTATGRLAGPAGAALVAVSVVALLAVVDPHEPGHYPTCPFLAVTGLDCPGCGTLRAINSLAHGHVVQAASHNLLTVLVLPALVVWWGTWALRAWRGVPRRWVAPAASLYALAVAQVLFWVLRNLPGFGFLAA